MAAKRVFIGLLAALCCAGAWAQTLWQNTEYGMTVAQVQQVIPGAIPPEKGDTLGGGEKELLRLSNIELVGKPFDAKFFFKDARLVQVTLTLTEKLAFDRARILVRDPLLEALRAKYGPEMTSQNEGIGSVKGLDVGWMLGRTNISLVLLAIGDKLVILNVTYQVRVAKEADKL